MVRPAHFFKVRRSSLFFKLRRASKTTPWPSKESPLLRVLESLFYTTGLQFRELYTQHMEYFEKIKKRRKNKKKRTGDEGDSYRQGRCRPSSIVSCVQTCLFWFEHGRDEGPTTNPWGTRVETWYSIKHGTNVIPRARKPISDSDSERVSVSFSAVIVGSLKEFRSRESVMILIHVSWWCWFGQLLPRPFEDGDDRFRVDSRVCLVFTKT